MGAALIGQAARAARLERRTFHATSGRSSSHVTGLPRVRVSRSMAGQCSAGTLPRVFHMLGALGATPMAEARADTPPQASMARCSAVMDEFSGYHVRDYEANTNVMQVCGAITDVKSLAERVKAERERLGMSQSELAKAAGVSQGTIGNLEAGIRASARKMPSIAAALRVSALWLAEGTGPKDSGAPADPVQAELIATDERIRQLLADLDDLTPARQSALIDLIHQEAESARAAADHLAKKRATTMAAGGHRAARGAMSVRHGDGNPKQRHLPLSIVADPFTAEPDEREAEWYQRIGRGE